MRRTLRAANGDVEEGGRPRDLAQDEESARAQVGTRVLRREGNISSCVHHIVGDDLVQDAKIGASGVHG